jgi:aminoglycoside phosphotransferase (APT) family kinase protein
MVEKPEAEEKAGWVRARPTRTVDLGLAARLLARALPRRRIQTVESLVGGLTNSLFKLCLDDGREVVLRIYEGDPDACAKEVDLLSLVRKAVPVPEVIWAERSGEAELPPFALLEYVAGTTLRELARQGDRAAMADACYAVGRALAAIGCHRFPRAGFIGPGLTVGSPLLEGPDPVPRFVEACLARPAAVARIGPGLSRATLDLVWHWAPRLAPLDLERRLVHCDFGAPNLLVRNDGDGYGLAAVIDWEFAVAATPLIDVGHFLRYERRARPLREPHFTRAFVDGGGELPEDWPRLARISDLSALCEMLSREALPEPVAAELAGLVAATVGDDDPP